MTTFKKWPVLALLTAIGLHAQPSMAAATVNRLVGTCVPTPVVSVKSKHTTIQNAVDAAIVAGVPSNILICPGTYREQVVVAPNPDYAPIITLKGINLTGGATVTIAPPATGMVANYHSANFGWVAAQFLARDTVGVTLTNVVIDGTGAILADGTGCLVPTVADPLAHVPAVVAGVMFANIGDESYNNTAGTVRFVSVHDQSPTVNGHPSLPVIPGTNPPQNCFYSEGVLSENSFIRINDNTIQNIFDSGILQFGGNNEMLRNAISHIGFVGIHLAAAHSIDVSLNVISDVADYAILLDNGTSGVTLDSNTISPTIGTGIYLLNATDNFVVSNTITGGFHGILLDNNTAGDHSGNLVEGNILHNCNFACISDRGSHGGNTIDWNDFYTSLNFGIWLDLPADDVIYSNLNVNIPRAICNASPPLGNHSFSTDLATCAPEE